MTGVHEGHRRVGSGKCFIVVPVYNEQGYVEQFLEQLIPTLKTLPAIGRIVFVDDGSTDRTAPIIKSHLDRSAIVLLEHATNIGKGGAMRTGFRYARQKRAEAVVFMDGDGQHSPDILPAFLAALESSPIVFGYRLLSADTPWVRRTGNKVASMLIRRLFDIRRRDLLCGFMAFREDVYEILKWSSRGYGVEAELATIVARKRINFTEVNVPTIYVDPRKGVNMVHAIGILTHVPRWYFRHW